MHRSARVMVGWIVVILVGLGCAPAQRPAVSPSDQQASQPAATPKRITASVASDFNALSTQIVRSGSGTRPGLKELEQLVHAGLTINDNGGVLRPQLAETVPSIENGLWKLLPDGRMETMWRLRAGARWHDGVPFTADDLVFSARVGQDREVPYFRNAALDLVERVAAPDARTLVVTWKQPYIEADSLFGATASAQALPLPRHLLEAPYEENKGGLAELTYWSTGFVGAGPYRVRDWLFGSYLILEANPDYVLGTPRISSIEVRFFADPNAVYAALLAGAVELPLGNRGISFEQALQLRDQWKDGVVDFLPSSPISMWPQLHNPTPAIIGDARFRRALLHAIDRDEMALTLAYGLLPVGHSYILPNDPEYAELQSSIVRYAYDPRRATEMVEALGYVRGTDGFFRADAAGRPEVAAGEAGGRLTVEIRASQLDMNRKTKLAVADYWQRIGVAVNPVEDPESRRRDVEHRATFPGFDTVGGASGVDSFKFYRSSEARLPQNGYVGRSVSNYMNPELDVLIDRYQVTIPPTERMQVAGQIVHHLTDQVIPLPTFHDGNPTLVGGRLRNVAANVSAGGTNTWNAHEWDVR
jgi:peptide/nickel transport system substrate-binding protein